LHDLRQGRPTAEMAAAFHHGLAAAVVQLARRLGGEHGLATAALSGGVFQNRRLFEGVCQGLTAGGWRVLTHREVPANDGGIALGQAVVAAAKG
jgi:hydrogenase maturation protein HypF